MSEYTPNDYGIRAIYLTYILEFSDYRRPGEHYGDMVRRCEAEFDRWVAEHDAEVAEKTLNTVIMLLNSELEETEPHPEEARGLRRALQIVFLLATRQGPRYET